ncbi:MAG: hypothetical protein HPY45_05075 [Anaerolineae bacterium]|nr:hypothetical protein [Anaerolineae bacterium]
MKKLITGNEAVAYGALRAGVKVACGYPGTPSTGCLASLLLMDLKDTYVEWSVNEKVAVEIAAGVAWAGHRALCTMKMSGVNVAYDSLISVAYSGCDGGMVIYVADDPGANAGMCEQDTRGFAIMSDMPMLEPKSVAEAYWLTQFAFELSEQIKGPVFLRSVTAIADSQAEVEIEEPAPVSQKPPLLVRDIARYTKAGSVIAMTQHRQLIERLELAEKIIAQAGINQLRLAKEAGLGIIACGVAAAYLEEGFEIAQAYGFRPETASILEIKASHPFPSKEVSQLLDRCPTVLVLEELEAYIEKSVYVMAQKLGYRGRIVGKLDGTLSRIGEYGVKQVVQGISAALKLDLPETLFNAGQEGLKLAAARPITVCAGCPHRGTYMAINQAIKRLKLKKNEVMVTGDIGCTILGMNPPFDTVWNEISMGASVSLAQGYVHAGVQTPVIATIGDSTFFHGGIPGLINAVQHQVNMTLIIMDNRWTAMTGMQVNPGTPCYDGLKGYQQVDIASIVPALGVNHFVIVDPFKLEETSTAIQNALVMPGVKVILARQECAIQAQRRGEKEGVIKITPENCNKCKLCIIVTGCPALSLGSDAIQIDPELCYGCGMCVQTCNKEALHKELAA